MPAPAPFNYPPSWTNGPLTLYHGTLQHHVAGIRLGINPLIGRGFTDFGPGFYTTTSLRQARSWAWHLASSSRAPATGMVVQFALDLQKFAKLDALMFVRGDFKATPYWSFVFHCRSGARDHGRPAPRTKYDAVCGPVAAMWMQRVHIPDSDQFSFHTKNSVKSLRFVGTLPL